jgi:hypothetical protein
MMSYVFLASFSAGLLLAVRIMFFGAERRRRSAAGTLALRRSEPALVAFLVMFGVAGYLLARHRTMAVGPAAAVALLLGIAWAGLVTRVAVATARVQPERDLDDPRFLLQGHVGVVTTSIPIGGEGELVVQEGNSRRSFRARASNDGGVAEGQEVCIEWVEDGVAHVELWSAVEARL